jgi:glycosyltransferase involved in cell wall biosynthesis
LSDAHHENEQYPFAVRRIPRGMARLPRMARTITLIARAARRAEVVYANGLFIEAVLARALVRRPLVMKVVGDWAWERAMLNYRTSDSMEDFQRRPQQARDEAVKRLRAWVTRRASRVIVPSRYLAGIVAGWGVARERIEVVYNAPDLAPESHVELAQHAGKTIVVVGRLVPHKGIGSLLRVAGTIPDVRMIVAGDGPLRDALEGEAGRLGLQARVVFLGSVSREQVARLLRRSSLLVLNSTYEGLPHVVLEAFAAGTPVLATRVGGTPEVIEHGVSGWLIPSGDDAELGHAMRMMLEDPALCNRLREGGWRALTQRFRWDALVEQTQAVLEGALQ